jgi:hypothetical protein
MLPKKFKRKGVFVEYVNKWNYLAICCDKEANLKRQKNKNNKQNLLFQKLIFNKQHTCFAGF